MQGLLVGAPAEHECECLIQDEIGRKDSAAVLAAFLVIKHGLRMERILGVSQNQPPPGIYKNLHARSSPYNSSSIPADNFPSPVVPITSRKGSGFLSSMPRKS